MNLNQVKFHKMTKNLKIERIKKVFKKIFPKQKINKNFTNLQIGSIHEWDSLRNLNLILEIEKEFKFKFSANVFSNIKSIKDIISNVK